MELQTEQIKPGLDRVWLN